MSKKNIFGILFAVLFFVLIFVVPPESIGLIKADTGAGNVIGLRTLGVLLIMMSLLLTETFPTAITCFLGISLMFLFKCTNSFADSLSGFTNTTSFFVIVSFALSKAVTKTPLSSRLLNKMFKLFGKSVKSMLLAFMLTAATLSAFISNVATAAIFCVIAIDFLKVFPNEEDRKSAGKCFMIGLAIAATLGGMATPAGSSLNLNTIDLLQTYTGIRVTFVQWMLFGIPLTYLSVPFTWFLLCKVFKMPELEKSLMVNYNDELSQSIPKKMEPKEKYVLALIFLMFTFWILSSWYPVFDITLVATLGCVLMFLPKFEVLTFKEYMSSITWTPYIVISTMVMMGKKLVANGVTVWLCNLIFPKSLDASAFVLVLVVAVIIFLLMVIIPSAPAIINLLTAPLITLAGTLGVAPALFVMPLGLCSGNCIIFPFDTVPAITYAHGYYTMGDLPKISALVQVFLALLCAIWIPLAASICGLA